MSTSVQRRALQRVSWTLRGRACEGVATDDTDGGSTRPLGNQDSWRDGGERGKGGTEEGELGREGERKERRKGVRRVRERGREEGGKEGCPESEEERERGWREGRASGE